MQFFCEVEEEDGITELELADGSVYFKCASCGERVYTSIVDLGHRGIDSGWMCKLCQEKKNELRKNIKFAESFSRMLSRKIEIEDIVHFSDYARSIGAKINVKFIREYFKDYPPLREMEQYGQKATLISTSSTGRKVFRIESDY